MDISSLDTESLSFTLERIVFSELQRQIPVYGNKPHSLPI